MPVTERLMKPGTWDIALVPETPKGIRDILQPFGHIVIAEARFDPRIAADVDVLSAAIYVGPLRRKPTPYTLQGAGMLIWLGDEEAKGYQPGLAVQYTQTGATFATWVAYILGGAITAGTITAVAGTLTYTAPLQSTQRSVLDFIMQMFAGGEYRVNNNGTLDAGPSASLFKVTPTTIVMPREGGREIVGLLGLQPDVFETELDADSYSTSVILVGNAGKAQANGPATPYKDIHGGAVQLVRVVNNSAATAGTEAAAAAAEVLKYAVRQVVKLSTDRYDVPHDVRAGDWLHVFDPEADLVDTTNPQNYRGQIVHPNKLRVFAMTWPVEVGMAVYYRDLNGVYTDISNWVAYEQPGTTFEVGAPLRGLTVP
jgi:hypothetical protein